MTWIIASNVQENSLKNSAFEKTFFLRLIHFLTFIKVEKENEINADKANKGFPCKILIRVFMCLALWLLMLLA